MEKINKLLEPDNPVGQLFSLAEKHSKVPKAYLFLGAAVLLAVYLLFGPGASLLAMLIGFLYPAYRSVFAIESEETEDDTQWLTYWVVYGFFGLAEFFTDLFLSWIPFYYLLKCAFLIWCMAPIPNNGAVVIYKNIIFPYVSKYSSQIDKVLDKGKDAMQEVVSDVTARAGNIISQTVSSTIQSVAQGEPLDPSKLTAELLENTRKEAQSAVESEPKKDQ